VFSFALAMLGVLTDSVDLSWADDKDYSSGSARLNHFAILWEDRFRQHAR
jgi:hypothetical protein